MHHVARFGNRWQQNPGFSATFTGNHPSSPQNNNQIDGYSYDAAGNLLSDGVNTYTYDAENRLTSFHNTGGSSATYVYDALGQRVQKTTGSNTPNECNSGAGGTVFYIRDLSGHVAVFTPNGVNQCKDEIFAGTRHLATYDNYAAFSHSDWLGTERVRYPFGTNGELCTSLPFGDNLTCTADIYDSPLHFTGKERDSESGLDNFDARYYGSSLGRFMSPDPGNAGASLDSPQSWNAYSYVLNNPLNAIDPTGLDCVYLNDAGTGVDGPNGVDGVDRPVEPRASIVVAFAGVAIAVQTDPNSDWVSAEGVVNDIGSNQQFSCGGSSCSQDSLNSFVDSITGGPSSVTVTDESGNLSPEAAMTLKLAGEEASYYMGCVAIPGAGMLAGGAAVRLGQPVPGSKPFVTPGTSTGTSPASQALRKALPQKLPFQVPTPVGGPGTGTPLRVKWTNKAGAAAGRYVPFAGAALTAYSAYKTYQCLSSKP
jgi:RHS repeat-associated protein